MLIPEEYLKAKITWQTRQQALLSAYSEGKTAFVEGLLPELAVQFKTTQVVHILEKRYGIEAVATALDPQFSTPSPLEGVSGTAWLRRTNMVGVNVRTIQNFWNVVKYALTLPACQDSLHFLPIWEPGVVSSLYGIASWNINPEFFNPELQEAFPALNTVEKQLKATVNVLHLMGKKAGMDVIPHTDRYSEIVLANPGFFEWLQRKGLKIIDHRNDLHEEVQSQIFQFLKKAGANRVAIPEGSEAFFSKDFGEKNRLLALFGSPSDYGFRRQRRSALMDFLFQKSYEPVPATMAPPYRGLKVDARKSAMTLDDAGRQWRDYVIEKPQPMSRVFGPLTRFKFYENLDDNRDWSVDFSKPKKEVWEYFAAAYGKVATGFGFDFMRGDMSHVQMRADGVPARPDDFYDPLAAVKLFVQATKPSFGYFAESFLAQPGVMAYGDEVEHLEASKADTTLGDLQSMVVGSEEFMTNFRWYLDILQHRSVAPNFTVMTADKDDPRFDKFYVGGNEARLFIALLLPDMPSYQALGFECRDRHLLPAPNEHYTKLYVFQIGTGEKATHRPFIWGKNVALFDNLLKIRCFAERFLPETGTCTSRWLRLPHPTPAPKWIAWTFEERPDYLLVVNLDLEHGFEKLSVPGLPEGEGEWSLEFSTLGSEATLKEGEISSLKPGEGLVFINGKW